MFELIKAQQQIQFNVSSMPQNGSEQLDHAQEQQTPEEHSLSRPVDPAENTQHTQLHTQTTEQDLLESL